jgi:hypothetical protein
MKHTAMSAGTPQHFANNVTNQMFVKAHSYIHAIEQQ